jgi:hypothetical protein
VHPSGVAQPDVTELTRPLTESDFSVFPNAVVSRQTGPGTVTDS